MNRERNVSALRITDFGSAFMVISLVVRLYDSTKRQASFLQSQIPSRASCFVWFVVSLLCIHVYIYNVSTYIPTRVRLQFRSRVQEPVVGWQATAIRYRKYWRKWGEHVRHGKERRRDDTALEDRCISAYIRIIVYTTLSFPTLYFVLLSNFGKRPRDEILETEYLLQISIVSFHYRFK